MPTPPPPLTVPLAPEAILARLDTLARRGKLGDFHAAPAPNIFAITAYGEPFDHHLTAAATQADGSTTITYALSILKRMPTIAAIVIALSIWPGVWLTHSMVVTYFESYPSSIWITCAWYLPLSALPVPWMWVRMIRKSRAAAEKHATELAAAIATELRRAV